MEMYLILSNFPQRYLLHSDHASQLCRFLSWHKTFASVSADISIPANISYALQPHIFPIVALLIYFFILFCVYGCMSAYTPVPSEVHRGKWRHRQLLTSLWVLEIELGSSRKAAIVLKNWASLQLLNMITLISSLFECPNTWNLSSPS